MTPDGMVNDWQSEWFAANVTLAHRDGLIPHGAVRPDKMPFLGDLFVVENADGTDTMWVWFGKWEKGPALMRPRK